MRQGLKACAAGLIAAIGVPTFADNCSNSTFSALTAGDCRDAVVSEGNDLASQRVGARLYAVDPSAGGAVIRAGSPPVLSDASLHVAAVPEPGTAGPLLAGAGIVAYIARRRRGR
jgi:hypothetical protein